MALSVRRSITCFVLWSLLSILTYGHYVVDTNSMYHLAYDVVDPNATDVIQSHLAGASVSYQHEDDVAATDVSDVVSGAYQEKDLDNMQLAIEDMKKNVEMSTVESVAEPMEADMLMPDEANEPIVTQKKNYCLGCTTQVDIDISPENREAVEKMGEEIVKLMDSMYVGPFIHARPNILSVAKQVELGIKYIVTFESRLSSCHKGDTRKRSECPPQEEVRICVAELIKKPGKVDEVVSNNCTDFASHVQPNNIPVLKTNKENFVQYESVPAEHDDSVMEQNSPRESPDSSEEDLGFVQSTNLPEESAERYESAENMSVRLRRGTNVGALKDVGSEEKDLISQFAQLAVETLDEVDPDNNKRVVLRVIDAKKQIVNGIMYHLVLHVASSNCPEGEGTHEDSSLNCVEDQLHPEKICRIQIHRSWSGDSSQNAKVVKSECADLWLDGANDHPIASARSGRSSLDGDDDWAHDNDWEKYDMEDHALEDCLHRAIDSLHNILLLDDVSKFATMMDAHSRINKKTLEQELAVMVHFPQPGRLKATEDILKPVVVGYRVNCSKRQRRSSPGIPGGVHDADAKDDYVQELITFGLGEIEKKSNSPYRLVITKTIQVQSQVVSGTLLHLKVEVAPTNCLKSDGSHDNCAPANGNEGRQVCMIKIWDQPWLKHREVTDMKCDPLTADSRAKRETLLGAPAEFSVSSPYVKELAEFALVDIHKSLNSPRPLRVVRIVEAKKQIVSGTLMHIILEVSSSDCQKDDQSNSVNCNNSGNEETIKCNVKVWDQPWTNTRKVQSLDCGQSRSKREVLVGAPEPVDPEDKYVQELAKFAVLEIDKGTNTPYQQKVIRVTEAKKQVVAGILMHLRMELGVTSCRKGESNLDSCPVNSEEKQVCSLRVFDQSWTNKREVQDVQCGTVRVRRSKRHTTSEPNPIEVDKKDPYIIESAWYAVNEMDKTINSPFHRRLDEIIHASVEHAEQTTVKLHLKISVSSCRKNPSCSNSASASCRRPAAASSDCPSQNGSVKYLCYVEIHHRPWLKERYLKTSRCSNLLEQQHSPENNHLIGGDDHDYHAGMFREFMHRYNKTYSSDFELKSRFRIFRENLKLIKEFQAGEQGTATYGPTVFADLAPEEFKQKYLGLRVDLRQENAIPMPMADIPNIQLPKSFDWRDHNVVTPVKNQGACGSCWAFAVTGNLEGQYALKHGKLLSFSEQELIDCDTLDNGCKGGLFETAYHSIEQLGGLETESDYPYEGYDDQCYFNSSEVKVKLSSSVNITSNETGMAQWLVKHGPIAIGINANAMQFYMGGVSHPFKFLCSASNLDHGVLIVGYGVHTTSIRHKVLPYWIIKNSWSTWWGEKVYQFMFCFLFFPAYPKFKKVLPFWIIKNSWGERWGEQGYYRVYRGDGTCGVNQMASSGIVS